MARIFIGGDIVNLVTHEAFCDKEMEKLIQNADYSVCNFEAPVRTNSKPILKAGRNMQQIRETVKMLKEQGFNLLLLANNHIFDYGMQGLKETVEEAKDNTIETMGAGLNFELAYKPLIKIINGVKFGFINACEAQFGQLYSNEGKLGGYAWINHPIIDDTIIKLREKVDFVIFFAHAGLEHYDIPLVEWRERYKRLCNLGVKVVIAAHPHVPQGYEKHNDNLIFYSLGNFYFPKKNTIDKKDFGYSIILDFKLGGDLKYEIVFHVRQGLILKRISEKESPISLKALNKKLDINSYPSLIEKVYLKAFNNTCHWYYASAFNAITEKDSIKTRFYKLIAQIFFPNKNKIQRELLLLHLIRNETYRYITKKALEIRTNNYLDDLN